MTFNRNLSNSVAQTNHEVTNHEVSEWQAALSQVEEMGQQVQTQVRQLEQDLEICLFGGSSIDCTIEVSLNGNYRLIDLKIDDNALCDPVRLKHSLIEAFHSAHEHARSYVQQRLTLLQASI